MDAYLIILDDPEGAVPWSIKLADERVELQPSDGEVLVRKGVEYNEPSPPYVARRIHSEKAQMLIRALKEGKKRDLERAASDAGLAAGFGFKYRCSKLWSSTEKKERATPSEQTCETVAEAASSELVSPADFRKTAVSFLGLMRERFPNVQYAFVDSGYVRTRGYGALDELFESRYADEKRLVGRVPLDKTLDNRFITSLMVNHDRTGILRPGLLEDIAQVCPPEHFERLRRLSSRKRNIPNCVKMVVRDSPDENAIAVMEYNDGHPELIGFCAWNGQGFDTWKKYLEERIGSMRLPAGFSTPKRECCYDLYFIMFG